MRTLLVLFACSLLLINTTYSQWPADSTGKISVCTAGGDQSYPEIVSDGEGGAIIVWQDKRGSYDNVYAQRIDSSGIPLWTANGIIISDVQNSRQPKLVSDGNGGAIITWFDFRNGWPNSSIQVQRINKNGDALWQTNGVTIANAANSWAYPEIAGYGSDGAVVAWIGIDGEIYAQKIDNSGNIQWTEGGVLIDSSGGEPQIVVDDAGGAIITWFDYDHTQQATSTNIFAQRVNANGLILWTVSDTICNAPDYQQHPCLVPDGNGGAIISWIDTRTQNDTAYIYAQKVSATGVPAWDINGIRVSDIKSYYRSYIASDNEGGAIITWLGTGYNGEVHIQRINGDGTRDWPADVRLTFNTSPSIPGIISDGSTGGIVFWVDDFDGKIKVQHTYSDGTLSFPAYGKVVSLGGSTGFINATTDGKGKVICAWVGQSVPNTNIYANRAIIPNFITGLLDGQQIKIPDDFLLSQNYPNPFNPSTVITYQLPVSSGVTLKVYDVLGNEVATLVDEEKSAGSYEVNFNASILSSGIYFYKLQAGSFSETKKLILLK